MAPAFHGSLGAIAVSISPKGCHPGKPVTEHSNIASPGTRLSFCLSGAE